MGNLNQSEIDDLISSLSGSSGSAEETSKGRSILQAMEPLEGDLEENYSSANIHRNYRLYDFRRPEKLSKDQTRLLRAHFGMFWRRLGNYLANLSRSSVDVDLVEVDQTTYKDIFASHGTATAMATFTLDNEYQCLMKINLAQIFALVDRLMGGSGQQSIKPRPLTEFERNLCFELFGQMVSFYANIRSDCDWKIDGVETDERLIPRRLSGDEMFVRAIYDLKLGSMSGYLNLFLPMKSLGPILGSNAQRHLKIRETPPAEIPPVVSILNLDLVVLLGETVLPARSISVLDPGTIIKLDQDENRPLRVTIGEETKFWGRPGLVGNRLAISITSRGAEND
jgi:flagellar motor switch protein FliM